MPAPNYAAWPTLSDVQDVLDSAGITLRITNRIGATYWQRKLDGVTKNIENLTKRTWIPVTEQRQFDGSGNGTLDVDEIVNLTTVTVVGLVAVAPSFTLPNVIIRQDSGFPHTILEIHQSSSPALGYVYLTGFPQGRQNILVTADWGYGATIPADLWESSAEATASILAAERNVRVGGRVIEWHSEDRGQHFTAENMGAVAGWDQRHQVMLRKYTRHDKNMRHWKPVLV